MPDLPETPTSALPRPLYGLVLAGGYSRRMGRDKGLLPIGGVPAREHTAQLLATCCDRVFLSLRPDQMELPPDSADAANAVDALPVIPDQFPGEGPLGALHSAFVACPGVDWFILPCDLPNMTSDLLTQLSNQWRKYGRAAPAPDVLLFRHPDRPWPEPLCGIWGSWNAPWVDTQFQQGERAVKKLLGLLEAGEIIVEDRRFLHNNNYP